MSLGFNNRITLCVVKCEVFITLMGHQLCVLVLISVFEGSKEVANKDEVICCIASEGDIEPLLR